MRLRALLRPMRLHAVALALLLAVPIGLLLDAPLREGGASSRAREPVEEGRPAPAHMDRFDALVELNETRVRLSGLGAWSTTEPCVRVESWGGTTIAHGEVRVAWSVEPTGAERMRLTMTLAPGDARVVEGPSPLVVELWDAVILDGTPARIELRALDEGEALLRHRATMRLAWDVEGGPVELQRVGCAEP